MGATSKTRLAEGALDLLIALPAIFSEWVINTLLPSGNASGPKILAWGMLGIAGELSSLLALIFLVSCLRRVRAAAIV